MMPLHDRVGALVPVLPSCFYFPLNHYENIEIIGFVDLEPVIGPGHRIGWAAALP